MVENDESFKEYQTRLLKRNLPKKNIMITNSWGSKYIHRSVPRDHIIKKVDETTFLKIIREVNNILADALAVGIPVSLPHLGTFYIDTRDRYIYKKEGKIYSNRRVNWIATHKLWYEDKEAEKEKILIKHTTTNVYHFTWDRGKFINSTFFYFRAARSLKAKLKENIKNGVEIFAYTKNYGTE